METLSPKDQAEAVAIFRSQVISRVVAQELTKGQLKSTLRELSRERFRAPGADKSRCYSVATLERWYYAFRNGGLEALLRAPRRDRGRARALSDAERQLILDTRYEHPAASAELILKVLAERGQLTAKKISAATTRRLLNERGLDRRAISQETQDQRRRWVASHPGALWQGDVCHGPTLTGSRHPVPLRIHALIDDNSRYIVALRACSNEREEEMLALTVSAIRRWGAPEVLYLDNGSTYTGKALATGAARLGISLLHPKPYDPQARGKIERFWRTLRESLLNHMPTDLTLEEVQSRLDHFLESHYHRRPHGSLGSDTPAMVWGYRKTKLISDDQMERAMTVTMKRLVSRDGVVSIDGTRFEVSQQFLAGHKIEVSSCLVPGLTSSVQAHYRGSTFELKPLDIKANAKARRTPGTSEKEPAPPLDPFKPPKTTS